MSEAPANARISDIGEKSLIRDFIKPYFNANDDPEGVGDDCAMVAFGEEVALLSSDRVPADLTAFRLGLINYKELGDYLARLNLSDIAACGGRPAGLLLNLGLPDSITYGEVQQLCRGFGGCAARHGTQVLGGDITHAKELSISATSIGRTRRGEVLTRRNAVPGDSIFLSRPLGMTPAAFCHFLGKSTGVLDEASLATLKAQFTAMEPMLDLGRRLAASGKCSSCMDNTDGIGQSLSELAEASGVSFELDESRLTIPQLVIRVCAAAGKLPLELVFDGGADFSLVGTLLGEWTSDDAARAFGAPLQIIGRVEAGTGVWLQIDENRQPLSFRGWNYFLAGGSSSQGMTPP